MNNAIFTLMEPGFIRSVAEGNTGCACLVISLSQLRVLHKKIHHEAAA
jgi:hypothetical protein